MLGIKSTLAVFCIDLVNVGAFEFPTINLALKVLYKRNRTREKKSCK
jgi:hypothetical protein